MIVHKSAISFSFGVPPIGLAYIAGTVKSLGIRYDVVDSLGEGIGRVFRIEDSEMNYRGLPVEEIINKIKPQTKVLAISTMFTSEWIVHKQIIKRIKEALPHVKIVLGGEHASSSWQHILESTKEVDFCVIGEGDDTFTELVLKIQNDETNFDEVHGIAYRKEGTPKLNERRKRIRSVDDYKAEWTKFPVGNYLDHKSGMNTIYMRAMPILGSRGCPYQCTFCSSPFMWGTNYYTRDPREIVDEMIRLKKEYNVEIFEFADLSATVNKKWTMELCRLIKEENLGIKWQFGPGTRSEVLTPEALQDLKDSNLYKLNFAPESGSVGTVKKMNKRINITKLIGSIKKAVDLGLQTKCQFIIGIPEQTFKEMVESTIFTLKLSLYGVDDMAIYAFYPYPGSEISKRLLSSGFPASDEEYFDMSYDRLETFSANRSVKIGRSKFLVILFTSGVMALHYFIYFLRKPKRIFKLIRNVYQGRPDTSIEMITYIKLFGKAQHQGVIKL